MDSCSAGEGEGACTEAVVGVPNAAVFAFVRRLRKSVNGREDETKHCLPSEAFA